MFERLHTPEEVFNHKLGATLKMEKTVLEILEDSIDNAQSDKVKELLRTHHTESENHVVNVEDAFRLFGWEVEDSACPAIDSLEKEGKANIKKTDDAIVDSVILQAAVEVEHHEIAVYESLIIGAAGLGREDAVEILKRNIDSEQEALEKVKSVLTTIAKAPVTQPA